MDKRYQVFVSSTYTDLKEERRYVTQTLMEMDCIPAGMELFPAMDEEQWEFIKRVIDDCDYYILIVGARYGSLSEEGISYTEKEYDYAVEKGLKVIALIHGNPGIISSAKSETLPDLRAKLEDFRIRASTGRLVKYWESGSELAGLVSLSLMKTIKLFPAQGWVRASENSNENFLLEINELRKNNSLLETKVRELEQQIKPKYSVSNLAGIDADFKVKGRREYGSSVITWEVDTSWREIFFYVSPYLVGSYAQENVKSVLKKALCAKKRIPERSSTIDDQIFQTIAIQVQALGLVRIRLAKSTAGRTLPFWSLTAEGEQVMVELRAIRG